MPPSSTVCLACRLRLFSSLSITITTTAAAVATRSVSTRVPRQPSSTLWRRGVASTARCRRPTEPPNPWSSSSSSPHDASPSNVRATAQHQPPTANEDLETADAEDVDADADVDAGGINYGDVEIDAERLADAIMGVKGGSIGAAVEEEQPVEDGRELGASSSITGSLDEEDPMEALRRETELQDPEVVATAARRVFRDRLPAGLLTEEQYKIYERLYGTPLDIEAEEDEGQQIMDEDGDGNVLLREGEDGMLEEVEVFDSSLHEGEVQGDMQVHEKAVEDGSDRGGLRKRTLADEQLQNDIMASIQAGETELSVRSPDSFAVGDTEQAFDVESNEQEEVTGEESMRTHPFTLASRFGTSPSTLPLPRAAMTEPISLLLSSISNKHLDETAERLFGGAGLPYSPSTPVSSRTLPQKPIPIHPGQNRMSDIEADVYMAAVMPGTYAAVTSALTEVRRRLGARWMENLLSQKGGPRILDAGAGGAGVLAWREIIKAEWHRMHEDSRYASTTFDASNTSAISDQPPTTKLPPTPLGKATVLTGSPTLRKRASILLENTTFLPRLPDYAHAESPPEESQRKHFDVIVAPHTLWNQQENYERKQKVLSLWSLLEPNGGVLVLLEKGVPRGFEVIADARDYLLRHLFEDTGSDNHIDPLKDTESQPQDARDAASSATPEHSESRAPRKPPRRAPGRILAPCPHHSKCPLYLVPGVSRQRKDYCRFSQRYIRPGYLQRMLGAKDRNHDDVEFSYVAVQKGVSPITTSTSTSTSKHDANANANATTDRAFQGYSLTDPDVDPTAHPSPTRDPLPRILLPPLKRQGHVHLDVCLPSGAAERWTVPRSFGRRPYRDARKARWGDLWALGAKQREPRRVRLGLRHLERGIGTGRGADGELVAAVVEGGGGGRAKAKTKAKTRTSGDGGGGSVGFGDAGVDVDVDVDVDDDDGGDVAGGKKKGKGGKKDRGRLKARNRRREETKALFDGDGGGGGDDL